jgi:hypothetical protein
MKRTCLILAALWPVLVFGATVESRLSAEETTVGVPVVLELRVDGTTSAIVPRELEIDGLQTIQTNRSTQVQIINGQISTNALYRYTLVPTREGEFEIPALEVTVGGKKESTKPLRLIVKPGTGATPRVVPPGVAQPQSPQQRPQSPSADNSSSRIAYAEVIIPKKTVYAGELVPVEIRFYFNVERYQFQLTPRDPRFSGEGFTVAKLVRGEVSDQVIDEEHYRVLTYKTAITAVKSGELEIPAVSYPVYVDMPSDAPGGFDDMLSQFFGGRPPGMFRETREMDVTSEPFTIQVKPLPREGRPAGFSGAIGEFTMTSSADPTKAGTGEPITLRLAISGQGNFDSLTEPKLLNTDGWRVYPATERFEMSDAVGFSGTKLFDQPIVAQTAQTQTPVGEFTFFNPAKEEYVTLRSEPVPVEAEASGSAPAATAQVEGETTPTPQPTPGETGRWIADMRRREFRPLLTAPAFWIANGAAALLLVTVIGVAVARKAGSDPAAHRRALVRRRDQLLRGIESQTDEVFHERAVHVMEIQAELDGVGGAVEWVRRGRGRRSDECTRQLESILDRADAAKFGGGVAVAVDAETRRLAAAALKEACK